MFRFGSIHNYNMLRSVLLFLLVDASINTGLGQLIVKIKNGEVSGRIKHSYSNKSYVAFEGIPYAKPPVGDLRFKEALPAEPWTGVLKADKHYICPQFIPLLATSYRGTEDCLYINVYVPGDNVDPSSSKDVVAHIHGGAFLLGSPRMLAGSNYIMNGDVIYVNFNYRVGILGFLSTQDDVAPGNNGLKDQTLALKWIQENIASFGGNPNSVTLTGLSAGSTSVHYHYLSEKSKGLFHRGLAMSGSVLNPWSFVKNPAENAKKLGEIMQCPTGTSAEMVECLRTKPAKDVAIAVKQFFAFMDIMPVDPFGPVIEKGSSGFLVEHPYKLLSEGKLVNDVPLITSTVKDEGLYPVGFFSMFKKLDEINERWNEIMPYALDYSITLDKSKHDEASEKIKKHYFGNEPVSRGTVNTLVKLFSDRLFYLGIQQGAKLHASVSKAPVYFYYFSYRPQQFGMFPDLEGVAHSDDSKLLFDLISNPPTLPKGDVSVMELMTNMIFEYAKTGKPSVPKVEWVPLKGSGDYNCLSIISGDDYKMVDIKEFADKEFWDGLGFMENEKLAL